MATRKKVQKTEPQIETATAPDATTATVYAHTGAHIRTYTREIHGDDFIEYANQMAAQHPDSHIDVH